MRTVMIGFFCIVVSVRVFAQYDAIYTRFEQQYGLPSGLLAFVAEHESQHGTIQGNIKAWDMVNQTQRAALRQMSAHTGRCVLDFLGNQEGALGHMQFMPATWTDFGVDGDGDGIADVLNPIDNIAGAAHYLSHLLKRSHGDVTDALRRYTRGARYITNIQLAGGHYEF